MFTVTNHRKKPVALYKLHDKTTVQDGYELNECGFKQTRDINAWKEWEPLARGSGGTINTVTDSTF